MRNYVKNKLQMYQAVRKVIQSNNASWNGLVAFENAVTRFSQKVTELENLTYEKSKALLGMKSKRDQKRNHIAEQALYLSNALYAYASIIEDEKLKAEVHYSPSEINYATLPVFMRIVSGLINVANDSVNELADYGIDQTKIDDLTTAHMEFIEISNLPRQAVVSRKVITQQIDDAITEIDDVLKSQMDKLIVLLAKNAPTFVMTYEGARTIIDRRATRKAKDEHVDVDVGDESDDSIFPEGEGNNSP